MRQRRLLDLDDAPELDPGEETALEAIRRQLDEEFAGTGTPAGPSRAPEDRRPPETDLRSAPASPTELPARPGWARPPPEREGVSRLPPDTVERHGLRGRQPPTWGRPPRSRDERPSLPGSRGVRVPSDRFAAHRIPSKWREVAPPTPDEPRSRPNVFFTVGLAAGLTGGAAGALLTVLVLTGGSFDGLQQAWGTVVAAARDSGLVDMAATVRDRALPARSRSGAADTARATQSPGPPPASAPRRGPVTTSEIPEPVREGGRGAAAAASIELRGLVAAGRDAYVRRDYAMAERLFSQAVERSMSDGLLRYHHAIALMGLGRFGEARSQFQNALRLGVDPTVADEAQRALAQLSTSRRRR